MDRDIYFSMNPAQPWSFYPLGLPAFAIVAALLILVTIWTYRGNAVASRKRVTLILTLRLIALVLALLTALRPTVGVEEDPKLPSTLLIGIDMSETMTVPDEFNGQRRIDAVRKTLEDAQPTLDQLRDEQNVNIIMYGFGPDDFTDATHRYDPDAEPRYDRSDYGTYLQRTFEHWQSERFVRANLIIGDGRDNGVSVRPETAAQKFRLAGLPVHSFAVGDPNTGSDTKDLALKTVAVTSGNPDGSVFIKTEFTMKVIIDAFGFVDAKVPVVVQFDEGDGYKDQLTEEVTLKQETGNVVELKLKAPDTPSEIKVRIQVPPESVRGDVAPTNNVIETFLRVSKEGMRILLVGRLNFEHTMLRRVLEADKRIALNEVIRQTDEPANSNVREQFNFEEQAYDAIILGNVSAQQLRTIDPRLPEKIAEQVTKKGVGLLMIGGHATFRGTPGYPDATGWLGEDAILKILPVELAASPPVPSDFYDTRDPKQYQYLPTAEHAKHYLNQIGTTPTQSLELWAKLNEFENGTRLTGVSQLGRARATATVYAVASDARRNEAVPTLPGQDRLMAPMLVGHEQGANDGRVVVMAARDTYLWQKLGLPENRDGIEAHARFWQHLARWLAHQEEDSAAAYAKPELKRLPVGGKQTIHVGLRTPTGADAENPSFEVRVVAPGEDAANAQPLSVVPDAEGGFKLPYDPSLPGEYTVEVKATGSATIEGETKPIEGEASARFLAYPEVSDEMIRVAADHDLLRRVASAGGGKFYRLEDLPKFLEELQSQPVEVLKPKPNYYPDWRRDKSQGFLPIWLVLFVVTLATEWGLRRFWGLV